MTDSPEEVSRILERIKDGISVHMQPISGANIMTYYEDETLTEITRPVEDYLDTGNAVDRFAEWLLKSGINLPPDEGEAPPPFGGGGAGA